MNKRPLVIGFGNPLRGDDAAGWQVARELIASGREDIQALAVHQLLPELAANLAESDLVLFIDARAGGRPGEVAVHALSAHPGAVTPSTHNLTPSTLLAYARELFDASPIALLITIAGESFENDEHLSDAVRAALPEVFDAIKRALEAHARPLVARAFGAGH